MCDSRDASTSSCGSARPYAAVCRTPIPKLFFFTHSKSFIIYENRNNLEKESRLPIDCLTQTTCLSTLVPGPLGLAPKKKYKPTSTSVNKHQPMMIQYADGRTFSGMPCKDIISCHIHTHVRHSVHRYSHSR